MVASRCILTDQVVGIRQLPHGVLPFAPINRTNRTPRTYRGDMQINMDDADFARLGNSDKWADNGATLFLQHSCFHAEKSRISPM